METVLILTYLWDGKNEQGKLVGSGIYFVSLRAGKERRGLKLTYMKLAKCVIATSGIHMKT